MSAPTTIVPTKGTFWKHRLLAWLAHHSEFPSRLRIFNLAKRFFGLDLLLTTTPSGLKLLLDISDWVQYQIYFFGNYEPKSVALFKRLAAESSIIFDIGSHIGEYALECAVDAPTGTKQIFALEVNPKIFTYLLKNIELNGFKNVIPILGAVSGARAIVNINIPGYWNMGNTQIAEEKNEHGSANYLAAAYSITEIIQHFHIDHVDLIKMDLEGHEIGVLRALFSANVYPDNILVEFIPEIFNQCEKVVVLLNENGYSLVDVNGEPYQNKVSLTEQNLWAHKT
jgi:FkbM family methyltransferase